MRHKLIYYRDNFGEGYALLGLLCDDPHSASIVAADPKRKTSIRMRQVENYEFMLDLSDACQGDRRAVLRLIAGMPDTFEQLKVLRTVSSI